uniref:Uncharacterized protein n=1 Tax=Anguilla anguilla TaxID=7936 RepID=A0A0E9WCL3_ANGAN
MHRLYDHIIWPTRKHPEWQCDVVMEQALTPACGLSYCHADKQEHGCCRGVTVYIGCKITPNGNHN